MKKQTIEATDIYLICGFVLCALGAIIDKTGIGLLGSTIVIFITLLDVIEAIRENSKQSKEIETQKSQKNEA